MSIQEGLRSPTEVPTPSLPPKVERNFRGPVGYTVTGCTGPVDPCETASPSTRHRSRVEEEEDLVHPLDVPREEGRPR